MREVLFEFRTDLGLVVRIVGGEITEEPVEAIVNAANERLAHGGGVAGAIVRRGGAAIQRESDRWVREHGPVRTGTAAITSAGTLPARYVIHAVGPVWGSGDEQAKLGHAVRSALELASEHQVRSLSLPAISSGMFGFPPDLCAQVILGALHESLYQSAVSSVREVNMVLFGQDMARLFVEEARRQFGQGSLHSGQQPSARRESRQ